MRLPQAEHRTRCADGGVVCGSLAEELVMSSSFLLLLGSQIYVITLTPFFISYLAKSAIFLYSSLLSLL